MLEYKHYNTFKIKSKIMLSFMYRALDMLRHKTNKVDVSLNDQSIDDETPMNMVTVRVSTKTGIKRWEISEASGLFFHF